MRQFSTASKFRGAAASAAVFAWVLGAAAMSNAAEINHGEDDHLAPSGKGFGHHDESGEVERLAKAFSLTFGSGKMLYHGGPVMHGTVNLYYIWYGAWDFQNDTTKTILENFGRYLGGTPWFHINTTYSDLSPNPTPGPATAAVAFGGSTTDSGSAGTSLSDQNVQDIVQAHLGDFNGGQPDLNGVYFVLTSQEVQETSGFCSTYCAWHSNGTINSNNIKFGFVGSPLQCPSGCSAQSVSPNGNVGADGMANFIAHELSESVTDPNLNAWFDQQGNENADKCAWKFGTTRRLSSGAKYNVTFGARNWLLQQNWVNKGKGSCALHYP
jgi:hypothetical protein